MSTLSVDIEGFWKDGYTVVKNVFSPAEVSEIRARAYQTLEKAQTEGLIDSSPLYPNIRYVKGDVLSKPLLAPTVLDSRLTRIAQKLLKSEKVHYYGDSNLQIGSGTNDFHKDNLPEARLDLNTPDWQEEPYTLLRFGIYLQDHKKHSGGLKVRKGSHWYPNYTQGSVVCVESEPGDVVVWTMRTTHSGHAARFIFSPKTALSSRLQIRFPRLSKLLSLPEEKERAAIFLSFAAPSAHLDRDLKFIQTKADFQEAKRVSDYSAVQSLPVPQGLSLILEQK